VEADHGFTGLMRR